MSDPDIRVVEPELIVVDWEDLLAPDSNDGGRPAVARAAVAQAFGAAGNGVLAIRNVPGFREAKARLFALAHPLVHLPPDYLEARLTDSASLYNAGWSFGKEKLGADKTPDSRKGSFYFNPVADAPGTPEERQAHPLSYPRNLWPSDALPELEPAAKELGCLLRNVALRVATWIDAHAVRENSTYTPRLLEEGLGRTDKVKGRLLYYFPQGSDADAREDSWIGWHNDSGFLTALAGDMYLDHGTGQVLDACPDARAGLYVVDRRDRAVPVRLPPDCCAVQIGEGTQIVTGGAVAATPHCVRGCGPDPAAAGVARVSLALFVDVPPTVPLRPPANRSRADVLAASAPSGRVPPLGARWRDADMTFGEFLKRTFELYYNWAVELARENEEADVDDDQPQDVDVFGA